MSLQNFLFNYMIKKGNPDNAPLTNGRIGDKNPSPVCMGGSYSIPDEDYETFLKIYER